MRIVRILHSAAGALALLACAVFPAFGQQPQLVVNANRSEIFIGESVQLTVRVNGSENAEPDLSGIQGCTVRSLGSHSDSRHSITIINGQVQRESFVGRVFAYELTPAETGQFRAGPVTVTIEGKELREAGPLVTVRGIEQQDRVIVEVRTTRESVLVDETFNVTLAVLVRRLGGRFNDLDPMDPADPPHLDVSFLEGQPIKGLEGPDMKQTMQSRLLNNADAAGFAVNSYTVRHDPLSNMFNFNIQDMMRDAPARFRFDRRVVERNGASYFEYSIPLQYTARDEGSYTFGPAIFKGKIVAGVSESQQAFGRSIFAVGAASTVRVVPPPETGRPPSFIGGIGSNMTVRASLDAQTCNVGDPLKLTIEIGGSVSKDNLVPPELGKVAAVKENFRVYDDTVQTSRKDDARVFTYMIRPTHAGTIEVPALDCAFYNASTGGYEIVRSTPIPLRVNAGTEMGRDMIIQTISNRAVVQTAELRTHDLSVSPMTLSPRGAESDDLLDASLNGWIAGAGPAAWAGLAVTLAVARRIRAGAGQRRRRGALHRALALLPGQRSAQAADAAAVARAVAGAIRLYVGERIGVPSESLTPGDARSILAERFPHAPSAGAVCGLLEKCFNSAYAKPESGDPAGELDAARKLLAQLDREIATPGKVEEE
jgi:hypothetical protein